MGFEGRDPEAQWERYVAPGRVTVIVPSYNHAPFVADCLSSIATETYPDLEVVMIDDGSRDGTFEAAQEWRRRNPGALSAFLLLRQDNQGLLKTLNRLVSLARGQYICLLASDDMLVPGGIEARVRALQEHPQWRVVFGDCSVVDNAGNPSMASGLTDLYGADKRALADPRGIETELVWRWSVPGPVLLADRRVYEDPDGYGAYPEDVIVEDRDFYLSALSKGQLGFVDRQVAVYRLHGSNASSVREGLVRRQNARCEIRRARAFSGWSRLGLYLKAVSSLVEVSTRDQAGAKHWLRRIVMRLDRDLSRWILRRNSERCMVASEPLAAPQSAAALNALCVPEREAP